MAAIERFHCTTLAYTGFFSALKRVQSKSTVPFLIHCFSNYDPECQTNFGRNVLYDDFFAFLLAVLYDNIFYIASAIMINYPECHMSRPKCAL